MRTFILTMMCSLALAGVGCATMSALQAESSAPAWTQIASCEQAGDRVRAVGIAQGIRNPAFARMAAGNRARAALIRCVNGAEERVSRHSDGSVVRTSYASGTVTGATIDAYHVDPTSGKTYALASVAKRGISPAASLAAATE